MTKDEYALTWWESLLVVTKWQWLIVSRDPALIYGRMIQVPAPAPLPLLLSPWQRMAQAKGG